MLARFARLAALLAASAATAGSLPQFPRKLGAPIRGSPVAADLTGSGEASVAAAAGSQVFAFSQDGKALPGYPASLGQGEEAVGDLAAADVDGDGRAEVAVTTRSGKVFLLSRGAPLAGFPVSLGHECAAGPSLSDVDGDGKPELLQGDASGALHVLSASGKPLAPFPVQLGDAPLTSSPSAGRIGGKVAIAIGSEPGPVHVVGADGQALPGFPLLAHFAVNGAPVLGDLDDDGKVDVAAASRDFSLHAVNGSGEKLAGFPASAGFACFGAPALVDLDADDSFEVAFTSSDGQLWAVHGDGKPVAGFPVRMKSPLETGVAAADLNGDGKVDLLVTERDGLLHVIGGNGAKVRAPTTVGAQPTAPFLARSRAGGVAAFVGSADGKLYGFRFDAPKRQPLLLAWAGAGADAARTGAVHAHPLRYKELKLEPEPARVDDALKATWRAFSVEGAPEPKEAPISWFRNGKPVKELQGKRELPPRTARKGETWRFELALPSHLARSPDRVIADTAPGPPVVRIVPPSLSVRGSARVEVVKPAQDADGDSLTYRYVWLVDGSKTDVSRDAVPANSLRKGQRWTAVVSAFDGALEGKPGIAEAGVLNSPPDAPAFALAPRAPRKGDAVAAQLQKPAPDPDGDPVAYHYRWSVNGERRNYPLTLAAVPAESLRKGDQVAVEIAGYDGRQEGATWSGQIRVANTPPPPPRLQFVPPAPGAGKPFRLVVSGPPADADGDAVTYKAAWKRNGAPYAPGPDPFEIPTADVKKGDRWEVSVTPSDGEEEGKAATAQVTVRNTPPTPPQLRLSPEKPTTGGPLAVEVVRPSTDVDGDPVSYAFSWTRNGAPLGGPRERDSARKEIAARDLRKHERVHVEATPLDGAEGGEPGATEVEVQDALPTAPVVAVEPASPTNQTPLLAVIRKPAADTDGDSLLYRYAWFRNGVRQGYPEGQATVPASDLKRGDRWLVQVTAFDGEASGPVAAASTQIGNATPPAPKVSISPARPRRGEALRAVLEEAVDPDGDVLAYRFEWRRDGQPVQLPPAAAEVPRDLPRKGETWSVAAFASDGAAESKPAQAQVKIANTPPTPPSVSLCDGPVPVGTDLRVLVKAASTDADGDAVSYRYAWAVSGQPRAGWAGRDAVAGSDLRKHQRLVVTVTPHDGTEAGTAADAECSVRNSVPTAPQVALEPAEPTAETGVQAVISRAAGDPDGDALAYHYRWLKNGLPVDVPLDAARLPPGRFRGGDVLEVRAAAFDGEEEGPVARAAAHPRNTPPPAPKVSLTPSPPATGQELHCDVTAPERDPDGDPVAVRIRWTKYGQAVPLARDAPVLPARVVRKNEVWGCDVWTDDGFTTSSVVSAQVTVRNSLPGAPAAAVEPESPNTEDDLLCRVATDAADPDGDPVKYRYAWTRNGQAVKGLENPALVPAKLTSRGEVWACTVTGSDGQGDSPPSTAQRTIGNMPPGGGRIAVTPAPPVPGQPLTCQVVEPAVDPDGDKVEYRYFWFKDGKSQSFAAISPEAPGRMVISRDLWSCEAVPSDGQAEGARISSAAVAVP
ncbi:MAG TPA: hypothetical protein VND93_28720 [Myxococcales bacterium]|nr:hypothetical protein [Myxococcales bacterium]